jgi:DNA-directed RNA polymerase beta' subunit
MPDINYASTPSIYKPNLAHVIKYDEHDIKVLIKNGIYEQGVLDKKTIGQSATNSIVHIIHNKYGGDSALRFIFNMQQLIANYLKYYGFSLGIRDMLVSKEINEKVAVLTSSIIGSANEITDRLNQNAIIPPIGMTIEMFYEQQQMNALTIADDFYNAILSEEINIKDPLYAIVASGSRGNFKNYIAINSTIGQQTINGERMDMKFGYYRTLPYFTSWDTTPASRGFISNSYLGGMTSTETFFAAKDARFALIAQALTTATTGAQSRTSVKNLESIVHDNNRFCSKGSRIVQLIYGDSGFDPRSLEVSNVLTSDISNEEFEKYHWSIKMIDKKYQNKDLQKLFDEEFEQLKHDREEFRMIMLRIEDHSGTSNRIYGNKFKTPVNMAKIIKDVLAKYKDTQAGLNYGDAILLVRETCEKLPYSAFNDIMWDKKIPVPDYWVKSMTFTKILVRSYLNIRNMIFQGINNQMLQIICDQIYNTLCNAYMPYGSAVGIIAAQSMSEPLTQFVLDSKHRSGGSGTKTDKVVRVAEIFGARPTEKMKSVSMVIQVNDDISGDESKVQDIANHIEMINVSRFLTNGMELFYESYGEPIYPKYKHEKELIATFNKQNPLLKTPSDLVPWCIRFELNRREMILKNMDLNSIIKTIQSIKDLFVVYTSEMSKDLIVRCYVRATAIKKDDVLSKMKDLIDDISNLIIRGIPGIMRAEVSKDQLLRSYVAEDGTIKTKKSYYITTDGTNLEAVLSMPDIDPYRVQSDSILEIAEIYGIEAAREKIINELKTINNATIDNGVCYQHCTIYADEMTITGEVTSIERTGINKRDGGVLLRVSTASPVQALEDAAKNNMEDPLENASAWLMIGCTPKIGSTFNTPIINTRFISESVVKASNILDDL